MATVGDADQQELAPLQLPETGAPASEQFCLDLEQQLHKATWQGVDATQHVLTPQLLQSIVQGVTPILDKEPTLLEIQPSLKQQRVTVVGDTHGQYHDLCRLFEQFGHPSTDRIYIFNGDYVDRGAWGVETLMLLLAWKWALPHNVYLLRGNHETNCITRIYGFYAEMKAKYGAAAKGLFAHIRRMFACLPLAALVEGSTLILHGGLFRAPPKKGKGSKRRRSTGVRGLTLGTLGDLRQASKGGQDVDAERSVKNQIASDVMWSDPVNAPGLHANDARGCGTVYGPDITQAFLSANGLRLIIRSHEGPDARDRRQEGDRMPSVESGYAVDHTGPSGRLVTLFSAPDYPQFMADGEERYRNRGAVAHLDAPGYASPAVESYEAVLPRPQVESYYDVPGFSDDEDELEQHSGDEQAAGDTTSTATAATAAAAAAPDTAAAGDGADPQPAAAAKAEAAAPAASAEPGAGMAAEAAAQAPAAAGAAAGVPATAFCQQLSGSCSVDDAELAHAGTCSSSQPAQAAPAVAQEHKQLITDTPAGGIAACTPEGMLVSSQLQQQGARKADCAGMASSTAERGAADQQCAAGSDGVGAAVVEQGSSELECGDAAADERPAKRHKADPACF